MPKKAKTTSRQTTAENTEPVSNAARTRTHLEEIRIRLNDLSGLLSCAREACMYHKHDEAEGGLSIGQREIVGICIDIETVERALSESQE